MWGYDDVQKEVLYVFTIADNYINMYFKIVSPYITQAQTVPNWCHCGRPPLVETCYGLDDYFKDQDCVMYGKEGGAFMYLQIHCIAGPVCSIDSPYKLI